MRIPKRLLLILLLVFPSQARAMSVEEAYAAIPHERTVFDPSASVASPQERDFLVAFFGRIDDAVRLRVEVMQGEGQLSGYDSILAALKAMTPPAAAAQAHALVIAAIEEQRQFLATDYNGGNVAGHPLTVSASGKLHEAYSLLMNAYPGETEHNKAAFFNYLCALDFM